MAQPDDQPAVTLDPRLAIFVPANVAVPYMLSVKPDIFRLLARYAEAEGISVDLAANELLRSLLGDA